MLQFNFTHGKLDHCIGTVDEGNEPIIRNRKRIVIDMLQNDSCNICCFFHYIKSEFNCEYGPTGTTENLLDST